MAAAAAPKAGSVVAFSPWHRPAAPGSSSSSDAMSDVLVIYTGGTLGMQKDETGALAPKPGTIYTYWWHIAAAPSFWL